MTDISDDIKNGSIVIDHLHYDKNTRTYSLSDSILWIGSATEDLFITLKGEVFNGKGHSINMGHNGTLNSLGLFAINSSTTRSTIKRLTVRSTVISLTNQYGGGIVRGGQSNFKIISCHHHGNIVGVGAGGIYAGQYNQPLNIYQPSIVKSTSHGDVIGASAGGICGSTNTAFIFRCTHYGNINAINAGGICGDFFNGTVIRSKHRGSINFSSCGGILGNIPQSVVVSKCSHKGIIAGDGSGGITGAYTGSSSTAYIQNCYSHGNIEGTGSGGICGKFTGSCSGGDVCTSTCFINGCYSSGNIYGNNSGGICGTYTAFGYFNGYSFSANCTIVKSYSLGNIIGQYAGGICGSNTSNDNNNISAICSITDCYSTGNIYTTCGGICGSGTSSISTSNICTITNCYASGDISNNNAYGIASPPPTSTGTLTLSNCYSNGQLSQIRGKLANLDPLDWKKSNHLPILRQFITSPWHHYKHNIDKAIL